MRTVIAGDGANCKLDYVCWCSKAFPTTSQLLMHQGHSKQQPFRLAAVLPPPSTANERQKLQKQANLIKWQEVAGNTACQQVQRGQPVRSDFFDALFGGCGQPCACILEEPLNHGEQPPARVRGRRKPILQPFPP